MSAGRRSTSRPAVRAQALLREADAARRAAYAPYSRFAVGAALLTASGRIVHGCNVENESLGLTICAERNAVGRAVASGERRFVAIAVSAGVRVSASPCGACRQVLHELAPEIRVIWRGRGGRIMNRRLTALLPHAFERTT